MYPVAVLCWRVKAFSISSPPRLRCTEYPLLPNLKKRVAQASAKNVNGAVVHRCVCRTLTVVLLCKVHLIIEGLLNPEKDTRDRKFLPQVIDLG